jgi:hypothetical protein
MNTRYSPGVWVMSLAERVAILGWIVVFIVSWVLFLILADWRQLKRSIWGGIAAAVLQILVDSSAMKHGLYVIDNPVLQIFDSSVFFTFGPVFTIGVLLVQFHPVKRWMRIANVLIIAALYSVQELMLLTRELRYLNWHFFGSLVVNVSAMIIFSWFAMVVLGKTRETAD